ncbi:MAG: hypothetical protein IKW80_11750, partial [Thermoguttaceae bacterium]|nr:hypothetical protein [Thermoguttaceae bacterium]
PGNGQRRDGIGTSKTGSVRAENEADRQEGYQKEDMNAAIERPFPHRRLTSVKESTLEIRLYRAIAPLGRRPFRLYETII